MSFNPCTIVPVVVEDKKGTQFIHRKMSQEGIKDKWFIGKLKWEKPGRAETKATNDSVVYTGRRTEGRLCVGGCIG